MSNSNESSTGIEEKAGTFVEGLDFYFEDDLMVLTGRYSSQPGYCCDNRCRHCPYGGEQTDTLK